MSRGCAGARDCLPPTGIPQGPLVLQRGQPATPVGRSELPDAPDRRLE